MKCSSTLVDSVKSGASNAAASAAVGLRTGFVDGDRSTVDLGAVQGLDRGPTFLVVVHRDESEAAGTARLAISDDGHFVDPAVRSKLLHERVLGGGIRQVTHVQLHLISLQAPWQSFAKRRRGPTGERALLEEGCGFKTSREGRRTGAPYAARVADLPH